MPHPRSCKCGGRCDCAGHGHYDAGCRYRCYGSPAHDELHKDARYDQPHLVSSGPRGGF